MTSSIRRCAFLSAIAALTGCALQQGPATGEVDLSIATVSTRPYLVTGGDVLLRVDGGRSADDLRVTVNGEPSDAVFGTDPTGQVVGLVDGLRVGANVVEVRAAGGSPARLELTNYPAAGPVISGPHQQPFICQTDEFDLAAGGTLGRPLDAHCSAERRVDYVYYSTTENDFKPYHPPAGAGHPADVATVTTMEGATVPFIVRVETGTVNRAIYEIAMLHDPATPAPDPWRRSGGWNGKLVYTHGGGCRGGWHQQGDQTGGVLREGLLEMGYAVTSSSLNVFGQNCNDLLASETHIMLKERFVEAYGEPIYTIATGASGGSYQSHQTADNYPGVFDGIIVSSSFPDVTSATIFTLADSRLLHRYFTEIAPDKFTREQQRRIAGFGSHGSIANLSAGAARLDPTYSPGAPAEFQGAEVSLPELEPQRYSEGHPDGIRATVYDHTVNVYGRDAATGFALRPLDNHGVQYGLAALNEGVIDKAQFIMLNRGIGGFDRDLNPVPSRHRADPEAARLAAGTGRILFGGAGLAATPMIDYRSYTDHREGGDIHMIVHQFSTRARLEAANGHSENHVMAVGGRWDFTEESPDLGDLFRQMDRWLMNLRADSSGAEMSEKVLRARPADLVDHCWAEEGASRTRIDEEQSYTGTGRCSEIYPAYPTPRHVAGAPLSNEIVSCRLKPLDPSDYAVRFTDAELSELRAIFPDGVCDWSRGDAHSQGYGGTWRSFGPSPVNRVE